MNYSRQREAVYSYLCSTREHPTAETIYNTIKLEYPKISLATVYRNLQALESDGRIQRVPSHDSKDRYDAHTEEHPHFICNKCNKVMDLEMTDMSFLNTFASHYVDGDIEATQLLFFGVCNECKNKK